MLRNCLKNGAFDVGSVSQGAKNVVEYVHVELLVVVVSYRSGIGHS